MTRRNAIALVLAALVAVGVGILTMRSRHQPEAKASNADTSRDSQPAESQAPMEVRDAPRVKKEAFVPPASAATGSQPAKR